MKTTENLRPYGRSSPLKVDFRMRHFRFKHLSSDSHIIALVLIGCVSRGRPHSVYNAEQSVQCE